jgi:hypothetical protein
MTGAWLRETRCRLRAGSLLLAARFSCTQQGRAAAPMPKAISTIIRPQQHPAHVAP